MVMSSVPNQKFGRLIFCLTTWVACASGLEPDQVESSLCNQVATWLKERDLATQPC